MRKAAMPAAAYARSALRRKTSRALHVERAVWPAVSALLVTNNSGQVLRVDDVTVVLCVQKLTVARARSNVVVA